MKAIISTTYDNKYLYFLPIVTWLWNKLGVDVICFVPYGFTHGDEYRGNFVADYIKKNNLNCNRYYFDAPKHKEATYAQCSRLYAACLDLPEDEVLVTGDIDMAMFKVPPYISGFTVFGADLVPQGQYPLCYLSATVKDWRAAFNLQNKTYQQALDELLGGIECENMKGNYWSKDQEEACNKIRLNQSLYLLNRARHGTQFADNRIDRDDSFWESRLNIDVVDAHLWRPGYTEENFPKILKLIKYFYSNEDLTWIVEYTNKFRLLI
jgi:hypothetical protein